MINIVPRNFSLIRIVLLSIGLWPYKYSKLVQLQTIFCLGLLISFVVYQLVVFVYVDCTFHLILKVFSLALFCSVYVIEYNSHRVHRTTMKYLMEQLQRICNELKDEKEIAIMNKYGYYAKCYTVIFISFDMFCQLALFLLPFVLYILTVLLDMNNEYSLTHIIQVFIPKYFIGRENYFYLIALHACAAVWVGGMSQVATLMMFVTYVKYTCGMFKIASYRIEKAMVINKLKNVNMRNENVIFTEMVHAIHIHHKAIKFTARFLPCYEKSFFITILIVVITLSFNLYGISEVMSRGDNIEELLMHSLIVCTIFIYLFVINYIGQEFMDHNAYIFSTAYNIRWYVAPLHVQKLILFLLQRDSKPITLKYGFIFVSSLEFFAKLMKASLSYFTVMCSMQN